MKKNQKYRLNLKGGANMTIKELSDLRNEFGEEFYVKKTTNLHDERYGNKIEIIYKGIIVGSDLVSYDFVRNNILKIK